MLNKAISDESLTLSANNPIQPALIYVQNGVASWTLRPDTTGLLRLQRGGGFVDVFTANRDNGNITFPGLVTGGNFVVNGEAVVLNNDSRLSDQRTPINNSVDNTKVADNALSQSKINGLTSALNNKADKNNATILNNLNIEGITPSLYFQTDNQNRDWLIRSDTEQNLRIKRSNNELDTMTLMMTGGHVNFTSNKTSNSQAVI